MSAPESREIAALDADSALRLLGQWDFYLSLVRWYEDERVLIRVVSWDNDNHETYFNAIGDTLTEAMLEAVSLCEDIGRRHYGWAQ